MNKKIKLSVETNNYSDYNIFAGINRPPINIVDYKSSGKESANEKHLFKNVVEGEGVSAAVLAQPLLKHNKPAKRAWRVLLDSGSDGDLAFVHKKDLKNIHYTDRFHPIKWETSNGAFTTTKVGNLDLLFPEFSRSKRFFARIFRLFLKKKSPCLI